MLEESVFQLPLIAAGWCGYFVLHSVLASDRAKDAITHHWPGLADRYRLAYNAVALVLLVFPVLLTLEARGEPLWVWPGIAAHVADGIAVLAAVGFLTTFFAYDVGAFSGLRREIPKTDREPRLRISFVHRFVRHPWYFFGLVMLWSREMGPAMLTATTVTTLYLIIGSRIEEQRLVRLFGERYLTYRRAVPGLVPIPGRALSAEDAAALESG